MSFMHLAFLKLTCFVYPNIVVIYVSWIPPLAWGQPLICRWSWRCSTWLNGDHVQSFTEEKQLSAVDIECVILHHIDNITSVTCTLQRQHCRMCLCSYVPRIAGVRRHFCLTSVTPLHLCVLYGNIVWCHAVVLSLVFFLFWDALFDHSSYQLKVATG